MKFLSKVEKCGQSPMRKFHPYAVKAEKRGIRIYHLNIGQPDVKIPPVFFEAVKNFEQPVLSHEEMAILVDLAQEHDLFLIGDEAYRGFLLHWGPAFHLRGIH